MCSDPRSQKGALDPLELELPELVSCQESNSILSYSKTHYWLLSLLWVCGHPEIHHSDHEHILTKTRVLCRDCCQGFPQDTGFPNVAKIHISRGFIKAKTIKLYSFFAASYLSGVLLIPSKTCSCLQKQKQQITLGPSCTNNSFVKAAQDQAITKQPLTFRSPI